VGPGGLFRVTQRAHQPGHLGARAGQRLDQGVVVRPGDEHGPARGGESAQHVPQHRTAGHRGTAARVPVGPGEHFTTDTPQVHHRRRCDGRRQILLLSAKQGGGTVGHVRVPF
jgi:hypothetical protein